MPLSPFNQYRIRKILAEYLKQMENSIAHWMNAYQIHQTDLNQILRSLGAEQFERRVWELDTLLQMYQELDIPVAPNSDQIHHIKQRILWLIGLRLAALQPAILPVVLPEQAVSLFRFNQDAEVQEGLRYGHELYGLVQQYQTSNRLQAYRLSWALADRQVPFLITQSQDRYAIWLPLRSQAYSLYVQQGQAFIDRVLAIHKSLCRVRETIARRDMELVQWQTETVKTKLLQPHPDKVSSIREFASYSRLQQTTGIHSTLIPNRYTRYICGKVRATQVTGSEQSLSVSTLN